MMNKKISNEVSIGFRGLLGFLCSNIEGYGVDKALGIDLVVVDGAPVPNLLGGLVVDVGKVTEYLKNEIYYFDKFYVFIM